LKHQSMMKDVLSSESLHTAKDLLKQIIIITIIIEVVGFFMIYFTWGDVEFRSIGQKIFFSAFHAVSAFCNAGFSLYSDGLYEPAVRGAYILHLVIIGMVILGGIGFGTIQDLFYPSALKNRLDNPWKDWKTSTKIAVFTSGFLLILGMVIFYILEKDNTLKDMNFVEAVITSFFQSGTTRTAGFNTVDIGALRLPTLLIFVFLMFIGGSSGSVAGGIKTSTFYLIVVSVVATIRGKLKIEIGKRYISNSVLFKALSIFVFSATINFIGIFVLVINEPQIDFMRLAFEQISAFGTVGLSTGITSELSQPSLVMIIFSMFVGRVGTLTFALALSTRVSTQAYRYPKAHLMVG
jgi:trk system potassium uptake protein